MTMKEKEKEEKKYVEYHMEDVNGDIRFSAKIFCKESDKDSYKKRLAVLWAIENRASLNYTNLSGADLSGLNLSGLDLSGSNLNWVNLSCAILVFTIFKYVHLGNTNFSGANLRGVDFRGFDLKGCIFKDYYSKETIFFSTIGDGKYIKNYKNNLLYSVTYTYDYLQISCERYTMEEWKNFTDKEILKMDGEKGLEWWKENKEKIFQHIKDNPAKNWEEN